MTLTVTDRKADAVTVHVGPRSATLFRSEIQAGLKHVTDPGTCDETTSIRGIRLSRRELERLLCEMGGRPKWAAAAPGATGVAK
jgi:hypothetical protein